MTPPTNLTGQRSGRLTAVCMLTGHAPGSRSRLWECRCDCGATCQVSAAKFRAAQVLSCGCLRHIKKDYTGQTFGLLTVLERVGTGGGSYLRLLCRCACGHTVVCWGNNLMRGAKTDCGCVRRQRHQQAIRLRQQGESLREIGRIVGMTEAGVCRLLKRAAAKKVKAFDE